MVHPDLLLMDEPFSALDVLTAETLRTDIIDLWVEVRLPIRSVLMVTHNIVCFTSPRRYNCCAWRS